MKLTSDHPDDLPDVLRSHKPVGALISHDDQKTPGNPRQADRAHLACIIPMYNEAGNAKRFLQELNAQFAGRFHSLTIIVVDDGSRDATAQEVFAAIEEGLPVHFVQFSRNFGKEAAITAGLAKSESLDNSVDVVLIMDADFQHPFPVACRLIDRWESGIDMIYGVQIRRRTASLLRRILTHAFTRLLTSSNDRVQIPKDAGDFRVLDQKVFLAMNKLPERTRYMKGLYAWVGFSTEGIPFEALPRVNGASSFNPRRLFALALDGITAFTSWPLRVASFCGIGISTLAFLYGAWIVIERIWLGQPIPGFTTLAAAIMFLSGLQLISIGLLGEYLGRVFMEVKGRPLYIIAEETTGNVPSKAYLRTSDCNESTTP